MHTSQIKGLARNEIAPGMEEKIDDLDDIYGTLGLLWERARNIVGLATVVCLLVAIVAAGILLALAEPPLALGTAILLFTTLLYRVVTNPSLEISP